MCRLRYNKVQAARDVFYMQTLLEAEKGSVILGQNKMVSLEEIFKFEGVVSNKQIERDVHSSAQPSSYDS